MLQYLFLNLKIFFCSWKNYPQKLLIISPIFFLFHKNHCLRDFYILNDFAYILTFTSLIIGHAPLFFPRKNPFGHTLHQLRDFLHSYHFLDLPYFFFLNVGITSSESNDEGFSMPVPPPMPPPAPAPPPPQPQINQNNSSGYLRPTPKSNYLDKIWE